MSSHRKEDYLESPCDTCKCKSCFKRLVFAMNPRDPDKYKAHCKMCTACINYGNYISEEEGCTFFIQVKTNER